MTSFFRQIMQMSISASYVILAVLLFCLLLKHAPLMKPGRTLKTVTILATVVCMVVLAACGTNGTQPSEPSPAANENGDPVQEDPTVAPRHELEMVSSQWGFATTNNWVLSADTGFFCLTTDDRGIFPTWYDPESMTRKDLGTEQLLPYMEQYALFTAGDRLVACTEEYSRINIIAPPYDEVTESYQIKDRSGKVWHIYYRSAIVYDRPNDTIYCSLSEKDGVLKKPAWLACVDLKTGSAELILRAEKDPHLSLFGSCSADMLVLMGGRNSNEQQLGEAYTLLFDLSRYETEPDYAGEELKIEDRDPYSGYVFSENEVYYVADGYLKTYKYKTKETEAICPIPDGRKTSSQFIEDGIFYVPGYTSVDGEIKTIWYNTISGEWIDTPSPEGSSLREGYKLNVLYRGFSGTEGDWYCLAENGSNSDPRDREYVFVKKDDYWKESFDIVRIDSRSPQTVLLPWTNVYEDAVIGYSKTEKNGKNGIVVRYFDFRSRKDHSFELVPFEYTGHPILIRSGGKIYAVSTSVTGQGLYAERFDYDHQVYTLDILSGGIEQREYSSEVDLSFSKDMMVSTDGTKLMVKGVPGNSEELNGNYGYWILDLNSLQINSLATVQGQYKLRYDDPVFQLSASEAAQYAGTNSYGDYYMVRGEEKPERLHWVWSLWRRARDGNETLAVEDLYPTPYSGPPVFDRINYIYISDDYAYYASTDVNQDDEWRLLGSSYYVANLKTGEVRGIYGPVSDKSAYNRMIGEYGDYLFFARPLVTHGLVIEEDGIVMVKKEDFLSGEFSWEHFSA